MNNHTPAEAGSQTKAKPEPGMSRAYLADLLPTLGSKQFSGLCLPSVGIDVLKHHKQFSFILHQGHVIVAHASLEFLIFLISASRMAGLGM